MAEWWVAPDICNAEKWRSPSFSRSAGGCCNIFICKPSIMRHRRSWRAMAVKVEFWTQLSKEETYPFRTGENSSRPRFKVFLYQRGKISIVNLTRWSWGVANDMSKKEEAPPFRAKPPRCLSILSLPARRWPLNFFNGVRNSYIPSPWVWWQITLYHDDVKVPLF